MITKQPLRELMQEAAEIQKNLNTENMRQIRLAIVATQYHLQNRYSYKKG